MSRIQHIILDPVERAVLSNEVYDMTHTTAICASLLTEGLEEYTHWFRMQELLSKLSDAKSRLTELKLLKERIREERN